MELDPPQGDMPAEVFEIELRNLLNLYTDLAEEEVEGVIEKITSLVPPPNRRAFIDDQLTDGTLDLRNQLE
jgi:hypothetical protein